MTDQSAGMSPAIGSALGALPQAAQGAATAPAQGAAGLAGAASPLAGLASGLLERGGQSDLHEDRAELKPESDDDATDVDEHSDTEADIEAEDGDADGEDLPTDPKPRGDHEPPENGPAQTRPARLL